MAACEKMVSGTIMSYPCELPEGHERNGPVDDPEPCRTKDVVRSERMHDQWADRQAERERVAEFEAQTLRDADTVFVGEIDDEPEHNLRDERCMMRPGDSAPPIEGEECEICNPRPQVLIENDAALMAGEMHNPYDAECSRSDETGPHRVTERCYLCRPDGTYGETDEAVQKPRMAESLSAPGAEPTKQRPGDQRLPAKGHMCVQDWVIETMEESKRVGSERYGQPLMTFDGRLTIQDLAEELRDAFVYISKLQMMAEADRETLIEAVTEALTDYPGQSQMGGAPENAAERAVDRILDWVLMKRLGEDGHP